MSRGNVPYQNERRDLIDPHTGDLRDFNPISGDPRYAQHVRSSQSRWGRRVLLQTPALTTVIGKNAATLIETGDLGRSFPIGVQLRFAVNGFNGPALPFRNTLPAVGNLICNITVRRGTDPNAPVTVDTYTLDNSVFVISDRLPFDVTYTRSLGMDVALAGTVATQVWVEAIAFELTELSQEDKVVAYQQAVPNFIAAVASPGNAILLPQQFKRTQFVVVNTSLDSDMIVRFGPGATWGGAGPGGSVVLPKGIFASYESPVGGYGGLVSASWNNPAPTGGALVTSGSY